MPARHRSPRGAAALLEVRAAVLPPVDSLLLGTAQLLGHLVDREIECDELVAVGRLGTDDRALAHQRELDGLLRHLAVAVDPVGDLHIQSLRASRECLDPGDLLFDNGSEAIGDTHSDANDARFHCCLLVPVLPAKGDRGRLVTPTPVRLGADVTGHFLRVVEESPMSLP